MANVGIRLHTLRLRNFYFTQASFHKCFLYERHFCSKNENNEGNPPKSLDIPGNKDQDKTNEVSKRSLPAEKFSEGSKEAAKKKLLTLLSEIKVESPQPKRTQINLNLSKPLKRPSKKERFRDLLEKQKTPEDKLEQAAIKVAASLRGDPKKTEEDLKDKLISLKLTKKTFPPERKIEFDTREKEDPIITDEVNKNVMFSVEEVASTVVESPSVAGRSKLTERLLKMSYGSKTTVPRSQLDSLVKSMKAERQKVPKDIPRKEAFGFSPSRLPVQTKIDLFKSQPLGIFEGATESVPVQKKTMWQSLEEKNAKLLIQFAPANGFEEMIMWTEQGKHWKFPIDNEIEMGDEEKVGFNEHVFLDKHLHGFPAKGPIRHFMELVVVGLSKNPYITVDRKIENIDWFRDYFNQKEKVDILQEYGLL